MKVQRILSLVRKDLKRTVRDPATLFMIILFPVLMTVMFGMSFGQMGQGSSTVYKVGIVDGSPDLPGSHWSIDFVDNLSQNDMLSIIHYSANDSAQDALAKGELSAVIVIPDDFDVSCDSFVTKPDDSSAWVNTTLKLYLDKGSMVAMQAVSPMVQQALLKTLAGDKARGPALPIAIGSEAISDSGKKKVFDYVAPGLFAFGGIFMVMTVAQSFTVEREQGLLRRMRTTPLSPSELMASQVASYMLLAIIQAAVIFGMAFLIGYRPSTDIWGIAMAFVLVSVFSLCCVGFGLITASISKSAGAATGISFVFIMPLMFLGTFVSAMAPTVISATAGLVVPSHYVTESLTSLFVRGMSPFSGTILVNLAILAASSLIVLLAGVALFRRLGRD